MEIRIIQCWNNSLDGQLDALQCLTQLQGCVCVSEVRVNSYQAGAAEYAEV